jgi:arylsulfatase A-like enzyme
MDLLPTFLALAGGALPTGRAYDGMDVSALFTGDVDRLEGPGIDGAREIVFWYSKRAVAIRSGRWKYHRTAPWTTVPLLFDVDADPGETRDVLRENPDLASTLDERLSQLVSR